MAGTKTSKVGGKNLKKESKEQKRLRLLAEKESFDQCRKLLPIFGGILLLLILVFSFYVNSIPPAPLQNIEEQKIDLRDFTVEQLEEMVQQSNDEGFASKIEEYKRMLESGAFDDVNKASEDDTEDLDAHSEPVQEL